MGTGYLKVQVKTGNGTLPIPYAKVKLMDTDGKVLYKTTTDVDGSTGVIYPLPAPNVELTYDKSYDRPAYSLYNIAVSANGYVTLNIEGVRIVDTQTAILPVNLKPLVDEVNPVKDEYSKQPPIGLLIPHEYNQTAVPPTMPPIKSTQEEIVDSSAFFHGRDAFIPKNITVHLGVPTNASAANRRVPFIDYVKNVASSEIYSTWPEQAIIANVHVIITFAINRIYTEWYRSRNYNFDITNSTAFDQFFNPNGVIYENISRIVDRIFNVYIRRVGFQNPLFATYCDGKVVQCKGLSQWGTNDLARAGRSAIEIIRHYYGADMELYTNNNIAEIIDSYPGKPLVLGDVGNNVLRKQNFLNRIRANYPGITPISSPDGEFERDTQNAVRVFQTVQNLPSNGEINRTTWNKISMIHAGVTKLGELSAEGDRITIGNTPPNVVLQVGSKGKNVIELQFILNTIAAYYDSINSVIQDGTFGSSLKVSVIEFQQTFNMVADGVVGPSTWNRLYAVYRGIKTNVPVPPNPAPPLQSRPPFPGTALKVGSTGPNVRLMQTYLNNISFVYTSIPSVLIDSSFGDGTKKSVTAFQRAFLLTADGIIGATTWNKIVEIHLLVNGNATSSLQYPGAPLRVGSRGLDVQLMQLYLSELRRPYPSLPAVTVDGIFGVNTESAVRRFQQMFGLVADGIIGYNTWYAIIEKHSQAFGKA